MTERTGNPAGVPWAGAARPRTPGLVAQLAAQLNCEQEVLEAVLEVEAARGGFRRDGTLARRFEPHHMPGSSMTWRDSWALKFGQRERMFAAAWREAPEATLNATSWGASQIMGPNARAAGFSSALEMVEQMADSEDVQLRATARLMSAWGLTPALRARDWRAIEDTWNGGGQNGAYARRMEEAYRRRTGRSSPQVLRVGASGPEVGRLQAGLGVPVTGRFDGATLEAVRQFQGAAGLVVDGIVGARTWAALEARGLQPQARQPEPIDGGLQLTERALGAGGAGAGALALGHQVLERAPDSALAALTWGLVALVVLYAAAALLRRWRRA
jgi:hypothetical protein